jgi:hydroxyacylglutathione hydrolase
VTVDREYQVQPIALPLSNAYLVKKDQKGLLVDTGMPGDSIRIMKQIERLGIHELAWIFLTHAHYDHVGSAAEIQRLTGAKLLIQECDVEALIQGKTQLGDVHGRGRLSAWVLPIIEALLPIKPVKPDAFFSDRFVIPNMDIKIQAFHTPGHTLGSSVLFIEHRQLFAGDLLSTNGIPHPQRYYAQDWAALEQSFKFIQELKPTLTYPGHGRQALELEGLLRLKV